MTWWLGKPQHEMLVGILSDLESLARVSEPTYSYELAEASYGVRKAIKALESIKERCEKDV